MEPATPKWLTSHLLIDFVSGWKGDGKGMVNNRQQRRGRRHFWHSSFRWFDSYLAEHVCCRPAAKHVFGCTAFIRRWRQARGRCTDGRRKPGHIRLVGTRCNRRWASWPFWGGPGVDTNKQILERMPGDSENVSGSVSCGLLSAVGAA